MNDVDERRLAHYGRVASLMSHDLTEAEAVIRNLQSRLQAFEWQRISTAPKDGTKVDLWVVAERNGSRFRAPDCFWANDRIEWMTDRGYPLRIYQWQATHWMPTPKPPA